jgi:hypothetical protein
MMERTAVREAVTHMLCSSWAMCFVAANSSENDQGSMNLASNTAPSPPPCRRAWPPSTGAPSGNPALHLGDGLAGILFVPAPVELLGHGAELDQKIPPDKVLGLDLAALFPPKPQQGGFVISHDDPSVGTAD